MKLVVGVLVLGLIVLSGAQASEGPTAKAVATQMLQYEEFNIRSIRLLLQLVEQLIDMEISSMPQTLEVLKAQQEIKQSLALVQLLVSLVEKSIQEQRKLWGIPEDSKKPWEVK